MPLEENGVKNAEVASPAAATLDADTSTPKDASPAPKVDEGATAKSSDANGVTPDKDTRSVVRDVVDKSREGQAAGEASPAEGGEAGKPAADTAPKEVDNENFSDVPFGKHPRFQHLLRERNAYKQGSAEYDKISGFLRQNSISNDEAANAFEIMATAKTNPTKAWEMLKPIAADILQRAGLVLPQDLKDRVAKGEMTVEVANEVSRARATVSNTEQVQKLNETRQSEEAATTHANGLMQAASDWQADRQQKDPNFAAKLIPVQKELAFIQSQEGRPNTVQGVKDQLDRAYKAVQLPPVNANPAPNQRPANPAPRLSNGSVSGNQQAAPTSTIDVIRRERAKRNY